MKEFIDIKGYEGYYQINKDGVVKSLDRLCRIGHKFISKDVEIKAIKYGKVLNFQKEKKGYLSVHLSKEGKSKTIKVHRLIATHFIPNPENKPEVNHKDGNKENNSIENLEWVTSKENCQHAVKNGLRIAAKGEKASHYGKFGELANCFGRCGELHPNSKILLDTATGIFYYGISEAAKLLGFKQSTLSAMMNKRVKNKTSLIFV